MDEKQFFNNLPAFQDLPASETISLLESLHLFDFAVGYTFYTPGTPTQEMFLLLDGGVQVVRDDGSDVAIESSELRAGEVFGLLGLVVNLPATSTARAVTPVKVAQITLAAYRILSDVAPTAALRLQRMIAVQLARELQFRNRLLRARMRIDSAAA
jgi:CRP-like cAMP-binding protein